MSEVLNEGDGGHMSEEMAVTQRPEPSARHSIPSGSGEAAQTKVAIRRALIIGAIIGVVGWSLYFILYLRTQQWRVLGDLISLSVGVLFLIVSYWLQRRGKLTLASGGILVGFLIAFASDELFWAGETWVNLIGGIVIVVIAGTVLLPGRWMTLLSFAGVYVVYIFVANQLGIPRIPSESIPGMAIVNQVLVGVLVLAALWLLIYTFYVRSIRTRLLIAFVLLVLISVLGVGASSVALNFQSGRDQAIEQLTMLATFRQYEIQNWVDQGRTDIAEVMEDTFSLYEARAAIRGELGSEDLRAFRNHLSSYMGRESGVIEGLWIVNNQAESVVGVGSTRRGDAYLEGATMSALLGARVWVVRDPAADGGYSVLFFRPLQFENTEPFGAIIGRADIAPMLEIATRPVGLTEGGEIYLVASDYTPIGDLAEEGFDKVRSDATAVAVGARGEGASVYANYAGVPVIGAYQWLPELDLALVVEDPRLDALRPVFTTLAITVGLTTAAGFVAVIASLFVTRGIANPLEELSEVALQVAAGDLDRRVEMERQDEVGDLARAFNAMTAQLRQLVESLEQRVDARTQDLRKRSAFLEASADIGRIASSILDEQSLAQQVVELIRERFGFYYVGLFLVDTAGEWAVLQAGTGRAGEKMLARGHRLRVGGSSMIGWCIANREARIASRAEEDVMRAENPDLPETRSEAALPLRSRDMVVGAITIQSTEVDAFDEDTLVVLQTMADQVAVAIDNARLFAESREALDAARRAFGELSREEWVRLLHGEGELGFRGTEQQLVRTDSSWRPEMKKALQEGQMVRSNGSGENGRDYVAVPIQVRDLTIGVLDTYKSVSDGGWSEAELQALKTLAEQLGIALEGARLYRDSQRQAAREGLTREITDNIRAAYTIDDAIERMLEQIGEALGASEMVARLGTQRDLLIDGETSDE